MKCSATSGHCSLSCSGSSVARRAKSLNKPCLHSTEPADSAVQHTLLPAERTAAGLSEWTADRNDRMFKQLDAEDTGWADEASFVNVFTFALPVQLPRFEAQVAAVSVTGRRIQILRDLFVASRQMNARGRAELTDEALQKVGRAVHGDAWSADSAACLRDEFDTNGDGSVDEEEFIFFLDSSLPSEIDAFNGQIAKMQPDQANAPEEDRKQGQAGLASMREGVLAGAGVQQYAQRAAAEEEAYRNRHGQARVALEEPSDDVGALGEAPTEASAPGGVQEKSSELEMAETFVCELRKEGQSLGVTIRVEGGFVRIAGFKDMPNGARNPGLEARPRLTVGDKITAVNGCLCADHVEFGRLVEDSGSAVGLTIQRGKTEEEERRREGTEAAQEGTAAAEENAEHSKVAAQEEAAPQERAAQEEVEKAAAEEQAAAQAQQEKAAAEEQAAAQAQQEKAAAEEQAAAQAQQEKAAAAEEEAAEKAVQEAHEEKAAQKKAAQKAAQEKAAQEKAVAEEEAAAAAEEEAAEKEAAQEKAAAEQEAAAADEAAAAKEEAAAADEAAAAEKAAHEDAGEKAAQEGAAEKAAPAAEEAAEKAAQETPEEEAAAQVADKAAQEEEAAEAKPATQEKPAAQEKEIAAEKSAEEKAAQEKAAHEAAQEKKAAAEQAAAQAEQEKAAAEKAAEEEAAQKKAAQKKAAQKKAAAEKAAQAQAAAEEEAARKKAAQEKAHKKAAAEKAHKKKAATQKKAAQETLEQVQASEKGAQAAAPAVEEQHAASSTSSILDSQLSSLAQVQELQDSFQAAWGDATRAGLCPSASPDVHSIAASVVQQGGLHPLELELSAAMGDEGEQFQMAHIASVLCRAAEQGLESPLFKEAAELLRYGYNVQRFDTTLQPPHDVLPEPFTEFGGCTLVPQLELNVHSTESAADPSLHICIHAVDGSLSGVWVRVWRSKDTPSALLQASPSCFLQTELSSTQTTETVLLTALPYRPDTQYYISVGSTAQPACSAVCVTAVSAVSFSLAPVKAQRIFVAHAHFDGQAHKPARYAILPDMPAQSPYLKTLPHKPTVCVVMDREGTEEGCELHACAGIAKGEGFSSMLSEGQTRATQQVKLSAQLTLTCPRHTAGELLVISDTPFSLLHPSSVALVEASSLHLHRGYGYELPAAQHRPGSAPSPDDEATQKSMSREDYLGFLQATALQVAPQRSVVRPGSAAKHRSRTRPVSARPARKEAVGIDCSAAVRAKSSMGRGVKIKRRSVADAGTCTCPASRLTVRQLRQQRRGVTQR
eukprot:TRINITY_DN5396_c0_g1_i9.p1 TRINITY_DN5396_c0_g1~~TRINITY_DN5396_c0_g1_i9.p1  ORF type:complete len:1281 (+),score=502.94 TRINITY_DN5396_c0_g1_i9:60-3902(+)